MIYIIIFQEVIIKERYIMKLLFISDIHGSVKFISEGIKAFLREKADFIVILGDVLYHGPRNPLPEGYDPKEVAEMLNNYKDKIIGVRGNCDSEVDSMLLKYPSSMDYNIILLGTRRIFITHGHIYNEDNLPNITQNDILVYGHTHIPTCKALDKVIILNPGSISYPKEGHPHTYGVLEDNKFYVKTLDSQIYMEIDL